MRKEPRTGCRDIWNAFMCKGAVYSNHDIPCCPTTAHDIPVKMITWDEAVRLYRKSRGNPDFFSPAFVCFYLDDYKFDGPKGIWQNSNRALEVLGHFAGAITPDFSTYQDFPEPLKIYNTFRMRAFGYWLGNNGIAVINNVRWGTPETWRYCWDGIPRNSIIAIGTVGGSPRKLTDRARFEIGLAELVRVLKPHTIIVYGSANYPCFDPVRQQGINIVSFPGQTDQAFRERRPEE